MDEMTQINRFGLDRALQAQGRRRDYATLTDEMVQRLAPSAYATQPWHGMSDRYAYIPTAAVIAGLRNEGFLPVAARQGRSRIAGKGEFTRHEIRFRMPEGVSLGLHQEFIELALRNAHDGTACYELELAILRLVCLNGMVAKSGNLDAVRIRHTPKAAESVVEASY